MDWVKLLLGFLKEVVPTVTTFIVGRKSKELEQIKDENDTLKKYDDIETDEHSLNDVYTSSMWK